MVAKTEPMLESNAFIEALFNIVQIGRWCNNWKRTKILINYLAVDYSCMWPNDRNRLKIFIDCQRQKFN